MIRTRAEIAKSMGVDPYTLRGLSQRVIDHMAFQHAHDNAEAYGRDIVSGGQTTDAQMETAANAAIDYEERLKDIIRGD